MQKSHNSTSEVIEQLQQYPAVYFISTHGFHTSMFNNVSEHIVFSKSAVAIKTKSLKWLEFFQKEFDNNFICCFSEDISFTAENLETFIRGSTYNSGFWLYISTHNKTNVSFLYKEILSVTYIFNSELDDFSLIYTTIHDS